MNKPIKRSSENSIQTLLSIGNRKLEKVSGSPTLDAEILLAHALKIDRSFIYSHPEYILKKSKLKVFQQYLKQRQKHKPIAYILGYKEFYGHKFRVDKRVLIPRPETEFLVEKAIKAISKIKKKKVTVVDICTGSGCIPISIAKALNKKKNITYYAADISDTALQVCTKNAKILLGKNYYKYFKILKSDLLDYFIGNKIKIDVLTANPPYIPASEIQKIPKQIKDFEPRIALSSGNSSNSYIKTIIKQAKGIVPKGNIFIEGENGKISIF